MIGSYWIDYHVGANISNVTLVSGTSTKDAGLMAGASSSMNPSYIKNCVAEEGVIIGYDKKESGIGSFSAASSAPSKTAAAPRRFTAATTLAAS